MDKKVKKLYLIPTTHWDREWYLTFQHFRYRLVEMMDELLKLMETDKDYKYFVLDGQVLPLYDYLEIMPEDENRIKNLVENRRLFIGPFFILPEEFLISGESHIRNLLFGHILGKRFGKVMKFGYVPDPFGHISQMPQILKGFNIDGAYFSRGRNDDKAMEFIWEAPDGSKVLCINQGYCSAAWLPEEEKSFRKKIRTILKDLLPRMRTTSLILNNGCDHQKAQKHVPQMIKKFNAKEKSSTIIFSNFEQFLINIRKEIENSSIKLETEKGEMRSNRDVSILYGILSTRMYLKQRNFVCQRELEKYSEPLSSFSYILGGKYPEGFFKKSWEWLLKNHPHDSICGCSIDSVHEQMLARFAFSYEIAEENKAKAIESIADRIDTSFLKDGENALILYNPNQWDIKNSVVTSVELAGGMDVTFADKKGKEIPSILLDDKRVVLRVNNIPAFGIKTLRIIKTGKEQKPIHQRKINPYLMENEYLRLKFNNDGSFDLTMKDTGNIFKNLHFFEDLADAGDEYNYSSPQKNSIYTTRGLKAKIEIIQENSIIKTRRIEWHFKLPVGLASDRCKRSKKLKECILVSEVSLLSGSRNISIETEVDNNVKDHRLRAGFPLNEKVDFSFADGHFDLINRKTVSVSERNACESPPKTHPQQNFTCIEGKNRKLTVINEGLPEYEATPKGDFYLTLLRGIEWLSREDLLARKGHAGPAIETPGAQVLGKHNFKYSLFVEDKKSSSIYSSYKEAYLSNFPVVATYTGRHKGKLAEEFSFLKIIPNDSVIFSCLKKKENSGGVILRFFNPLDKKVNFKIEFYISIKDVYLTNLEEEIIKKIPISQNLVQLEAEAKKIITLLLKF